MVNVKRYMAIAILIHGHICCCYFSINFLWFHVTQALVLSSFCLIKKKQETIRDHLKGFWNRKLSSFVESLNICIDLLLICIRFLDVFHHPIYLATKTGFLAVFKFLESLKFLRGRILPFFQQKLESLRITKM